MRTKLIGAALLAAGALSAMAADNVYSLNVVGYANVPVVSGLNLVANQFTNGGNTINEVLAGAPNDALALIYNGVDYDWQVAADGAWYNYLTGDPSTVSLRPGQGFFYNSPADGTLTFVGEVPQGTAAGGNALTIALTSGLNLIATYTPQALTITDPVASNFPSANDSLILMYNGVDYDWYVAADGAWYNYLTGDPVTLTPAVGKGFFFNAPAATTWTRDFTVGP